MPNIQINVLTTYTSPNSLALIYPLLVNRPFFNEHGIKFDFHDDITARTAACDILFINSKFFRAWHTEKEEEIYDRLGGFKKRAQKVIWFDTTDSTGTTQFNVMPFVHGYYKGQVLKDRSLYEKPFYGNRIFTDYYKKLFNVSKDDGPCAETGSGPAVSAVLKKDDAHKFGISWNSAMNDWGTYIYNYTCTGMMAKLISRFPFKAAYKIRFVRPDNSRKIKISGRIGLSHTRSTVRLQREEIVKILKEKFNVDASRIPRKQYIAELKNSWIGISPFGLGEISCRDFEVIINGALVLKQDMSHLETWPPLYTNNETYLPFSWDLKDFKEKLEGAVSNPEKTLEISRNAQKRYEYYIYGNGRQEFCNKVMDIIK